MRCRAKTKKGAQCKNIAVNGKEFCSIHKNHINVSNYSFGVIGAIVGNMVVPGIGGTVIGGLSGLLANKIYQENTKMSKRIFISFAMEDAKYRDFLSAQSLNTKSPFSYTDMSAKEPWDEKWKTNCRARIKDCDGVIALISKRTRNADGAKWEMNCANEEGIPMIGIHIHRDDTGQTPSQLAGKKVIDWDWDKIAKFVDNL